MGPPVVSNAWNLFTGIFQALEEGRALLPFDFQRLEI
jgi:hypothetical protein